jgi:hypothetical protein
LDGSAELNDKAHEAFRKAKINIINAGRDFLDVRAWNLTDK